MSADQCQTSWAHSTRERSIAENAAEKNTATIEAPVNGRNRNSVRSTSGLWWRAQCTGKQGQRQHAER